MEGYKGGMEGCGQVTEVHRGAQQSAEGSWKGMDGV